MGDTLRKHLQGFQYDFLKLDPRSAAAFRISFAAWLLYDLGGRWRGMYEIYGGGWVDGRYLRDSATAFQFSLLWIVNSDSGRALVFALIAAVYLTLMAGYRARLMTFLSLICFCSLMHANPMTRDGGEFITALMLMWACFLSLDDLWTVGPAQPRKKLQSTTGIFAARMQIVWLYVSAGLAKTGVTWSSGTALYYVFRYHQMGTALGRLGENVSQTILAPLTISVVLVEVLSPLLLLLPVKNPWPRRLGILALLSLQIGIGLTVDTGFQLLLTSCLFLFLQPVDWEYLAKLAKSPFLASGFKSSTALTSRRVRLAWEGLCAYLLWIQFALAATSHGVSIMPPAGWSFIQIVPSLQQWDLFAPEAPRVDGWWSMYGVLPDGREVDLSTGENFKRQEPRQIWPQYGRYKFKILEALTFDSTLASQKGKPLFATLDTFNARHPRHDFREVRFSYFDKTIPTPDGWEKGERPTFVERSIWIYRVPESQWASSDASSP